MLSLFPEGTINSEQRAISKSKAWCFGSATALTYGVVFYTSYIAIRLIWEACKQNQAFILPHDQKTVLAGYPGVTLLLTLLMSRGLFYGKINGLANDNNLNQTMVNCVNTSSIGLAGVTVTAIILIGSLSTETYIPSTISLVISFAIGLTINHYAWLCCLRSKADVITEALAETMVTSPLVATNYSFEDQNSSGGGRNDLESNAAIIGNTSQTTTFAIPIDPLTDFNSETQNEQNPEQRDTTGTTNNLGPNLITGVGLT